MDACLMLADGSFVDTIIGIAKVALALGFVIFVHELGHFAVAKWCGVQCDKFMVGFDIGGYKIGRQWGDTYYGIGVLPLGGYVKMMGQDDDPSKLAEQMKQSEQAAQGADESQTRLITGPSGEQYRIDRRSYLAKSVPQRMAIISAGVIMNLIFGFFFAVFAFGMGVDYTPCVVSQTSPGGPAYMAGLECGDEVLRINNRVSPSYDYLRQIVTLSDMEAGVKMRVRKAATGEEVDLLLKPELTEDGSKIGVLPPITTRLSKENPAFPATPAAEAGFQGGDVITAINGRPVPDYKSLQARLLQRQSESIEVTVERTSKQGAKSEATLTVKPRPFKRLGFSVAMGPIVAIQPGSPAELAGLKKGDRIASINGQVVGVAEHNGDASLDPVTLPNQLPTAEGDLRIEVQRGEELLTFDVTPRKVDWIEQPLGLEAPLSLPSLGLCYTLGNEVTTTLSGVSDASPLRKGDVIEFAKGLPPEDEKVDEDLYKLKYESDKHHWGAFVSQLNSIPDDARIALKVKRGEELVEVTVDPVIAEGVFVPQRGFGLVALTREQPVENFGQAVSLAWDRLTTDMGMIFRVLGKLGSDQVPVSQLAGPVGILQMAYSYASNGWAPLFLFLTMLSANLAVLNALPIPVLDGGHMVFLAYEGVRGRPANEKVVMSLHMIGFVMLIGLMVFALSNDIGRMFS